MRPAPSRPKSSVRRFFVIFLLGLLLFLLVNVGAAQVMSDCGLPSLDGLDACSDDIARAGWPLQFFEEGGLSYHSNFDPSPLAGDAILGALGSLALALGASRFLPRR